MQLTRAYAAGQQAKAAVALGVAQPPQNAGELPPGRRPRADGAPPLIEGQEAPAQLEAGQEPAAPAKVAAPAGDAIARALVGYQSDVPGAIASYDAQTWGTMVGEVQQLRKRVEEGKLGPKDCAGALLNMVISKKQLEIQIPAIEAQFDNDHTKLATLIGMALGQAPEGLDPQEYLKYKHEVLKVFVAGLREIENRIRAQVAEESGEGEGGESEEDGDGEPEVPASSVA